MSTYDLTQTEGYFIRISYDDGDVKDNTTCERVDGQRRPFQGEADARNKAREASRNLRATVDACRGATVLGTYRGGEEI